MKEDPMTETAATGSLGPVVAKLAALLGSEYKLRRRTRRDVKFIKSKFKSVHSLLWATWEREVPDAASKELKIEALVLADEMDDAVDDFILTMEPGRRSKRLIQTKVKASPFEDFKRRATDVSGRCHIKWKKNTAQTICNLFSRNNAIFGTRKPTTRAHPFVRKDASQLVAMDEPKNKLIKFLVGEDAESTLLQPQLKMASVLGMAGMGKTTLADLVYQKIQDKFEARAFVSVAPGRGGNMNEVLAGILKQVAPENTAPPAGTEAESEEHHLIDQISDFLKDKRYLVIIDDIWHWEEWVIIRRSLPENNLGSRVVTTTRIEAVAQKWHDDSQALLHKMHPQFHSEDRWVYKIGGTEDVCAQILDMNAKMVGQDLDRERHVVQMCAGMPLAVVCLLSAVAKEREKQAQQGVDAKIRDVQDMIQKQVERHGIQKTPGFEPLVESLSLGYNDLPHHMLKSCLLYCSIYAEYEDLTRGDLVIRWMAEGFADKEEDAESYYAEIVSRGLIFNIAGGSEDKTMHPMMRNFLMWKSHEDNFITYSSDIQSASPIRRLCIDYWTTSSTTVDPLSRIDWSHIRCLVVLEDAERVPWKNLQRLRVLDVQWNHALENHHLKYMCGLPRLRHLLGNLGDGITEIPSEIAKLQRLETLQVCFTGITKLPRELGALQHLVTLDVSSNKDLAEVPREICGLQQLRNLNVAGTGITEVPKEIGRLQQLKNLDMCDTRIAVLPKEIMELQNLETLDLSTTLVKKIPWKAGGLKKLKSLMLDYNIIALPLEVCQVSYLVRLPECIKQARKNNHLWSSLAVENLSFLQSTLADDPEGGLVVGAQQMRIPPWIKNHFSDLGVLDIRVCKLEEEDLKILRVMPNLRVLTIRFEVVPKEPVVVRGEGFAELRCFCVDSRVPRVSFQEGAMPRLYWLHFEIQFYGGPPNKEPFGIKHLVSLEKVRIKYDEDWYGSGSPCIRATIDLVRKEAEEHPSKDKVEVLLPGEYDSDDPFISSSDDETG